MIRSTVLLIIAALLLPGVAQARDAAEPKALLKQWEALNSACRGGRGDNPKTMEACDRREKVDRRLNKQGWCYGRPGEYSYQKTWRRCSGR